MKREGLLEELLKRRKLGIMLVLTGLAFILLFCSYLILYVHVNGPALSCRTSPLVEEKSAIEIMSCMADSAQSQERGLLLVPVAIAGGALVAGGAGVLLYPLGLAAPQRARDATWDAFAPRGELDLGPALLK
jgi:Na+-transporting methylmalonyl-CoA/oxaloacetate decarboxylase gamma subunit